MDCFLMKELLLCWRLDCLFGLIFVILFYEVDYFRSIFFVLKLMNNYYSGANLPTRSGKKSSFLQIRYSQHFKSTDPNKTF